MVTFVNWNWPVPGGLIIEFVQSVEVLTEATSNAGSGESGPWELLGSVTIRMEIPASALAAIRATCNVMSHSRDRDATIRMSPATRVCLRVRAGR
jgi:hypothetical protein